MREKSHCPAVQKTAEPSIYTPAAAAAASWKESPALPGQAPPATHHPSPGGAAPLPNTRPFEDSRKTSGNAGGKGSLQSRCLRGSPGSPAGVQGPLVAAEPQSSCPRSAGRLLVGPARPPSLGMWWNIWPDLVSRDQFVTGLGSLQLRSRPCLMLLLQRKGQKAAKRA